ncbi:hypothetical protein [Helicobacter sp. 13S00477-4]|uniref:hypothetical protein n=1 Tax=Helicobacter sp. 13S00477-4 TaxID=1905759 RepID=UPI000BA69B74|nr:hypothetical protein [Helicobacter sp. 13S00477-4]PAF50652.1 hypothetical protein BKH44_07355 [Helicobacter sp. 13S00477-4]
MLFSLSRQSLKIFSFLLIISIGLNAQDSKQTWYCPLDKNYKDYQKGLTSDLSKATGYSTQDVCETGCRVQNHCTVMQVAANRQLLIEAKDSLDIEALNKHLSDLKGKITGFQIKVNGIEVLLVQGKEPIAFTNLFPVIKKSDLKKNGIKVVFDDNVFSVFALKGDKELIHIDKDSMFSEGISAQYTKEGNTSVKQNGSQKIYDGKIDFYDTLGITKSPKGVEIKIGADSISIPVKKVGSKFEGEKISNYEGRAVNELNIGGKKISFISLINGDDLKKTTYAIQSNDGFWDKNFLINAILKREESYYTCPYNISAKGDRGENAFSSQESCEAQCTLPISCQINKTTLSGDDSDCVVEEKPLNPITDIDGKTIYLSKEVTKVCKKSREVEIGCREYTEKTTTFPSADSYLKNIPKLEKNLTRHDFSKATKVLGEASIAEQSIHVFSGESDYCDSGLFIDNPSVMDMAIKYGAMLAMAAYDFGADAIKNTHTQSITKVTGGGAPYANTAKFGTDTFRVVFTPLGDAVKKGIGKAASEFLSKSLTYSTEQVLKSVAIKIASTALSEAVKDVCDHTSKKDDCGHKESPSQRGIKNNAAFITNGASVGIKNNSSIKSYKEMEGSLDNDDYKAMKYVECMTSTFQLTYSDLANYQLSVDLDDLTPEEKKTQERILYTSTEPYHISADDVAVLMKAFAKEDDGTVDVEHLNDYFYARYSLNEVVDANGKTSYNLYALAPEDLFIAAETVCGGKDVIEDIRRKYGARFLNPDLSHPSVESEVKRQTPEPDLPGLSSDSSRSVSTDNTGKIIKELGFQVADTIAGGFNPPFNMIASAFVDIARTMSSGNTCGLSEDDKRFVQERADKGGKDGKEYLKTNLRLEAGLCIPANFKPSKFLGFEVRRDNTEIMSNPASLGILQTDWFGGERRRHYYCCYDQKITKIFAEGFMQQLGRNVNKGECDKISIDDLNNVSIKKCEKGEDPQKDKCFPADKFEDLTNIFLQGGSIGSDKAVESIINTTMNLKKELNKEIEGKVIKEEEPKKEEPKALGAGTKE